MKKIIAATSLLFSLLSPLSVNASTVLGATMGGDFWYADSKFSHNLTDVKFDSKAQGSIWATFEHPLPIIPNVMLRENIIKDKSVDNEKHDFSNLDYIAYYELFDNNLINFDFGFGYKQMLNGSSRTRLKLDFNGLPMGYVAAKVKTPIPGVYAFGDAMKGFSKNAIDYRVGLSWQTELLFLRPNFRIGYRYFSVDAKSPETSEKINTEFKGYFAGLEIVF